MIGVGEKVDVDPANQPCPELDVAGACPLVSNWDFLPSQARNDCCSDGTRGALSENACLRRALSRAIADGINIGKSRLESLRLHRHIAILCHAAFLENSWSAD